MAHVTQHFGITGPVPFADVRLEQDTPWFIEPSAIRCAARAGDHYAQRADAALVTFFDEVMRHVRQGDESAGLTVLSKLGEPNETRLGLTAVGVAGHGVGTGLAQELWDAMVDNPACRDVILTRRLEDLTLYVIGIGPDMISDICTRVTYEVLSDFTGEMMARYPQLIRRGGMSTVDEWWWDDVTARWSTDAIRLPTVNDRRLLLVPTNWMWPRQIMTASSFYQVEALGEIKNKLTQPPNRPGGKPSAPTKNSLKLIHPRVRPTNISQAIEAAEQGRSLTEEHRSRISYRFENQTLAAAEINQRIRTS